MIFDFGQLSTYVWRIPKAKVKSKAEIKNRNFKELKTIQESGLTVEVLEFSQRP